MRSLAFVAAVAVLCGCQTQSYKETKQLAGTKWVAIDRGSNPRSFAELQFGSDLSPSGMGQVRVAKNVIVFYQVINEKLVMRYDYFSKNHIFDYAMEGDRLTLSALDGDNKPLGIQHFQKHP